MNKQLEQLAVVLALGATAYILWGAYTNGKTLKTNVPATAPAVPATNPGSWVTSLIPNVQGIFGNFSGAPSSAANGSPYDTSNPVSMLYPNNTTTASGAPLDPASPVRALYLQ